jgi:hypothetical protein
VVLFSATTVRYHLTALKTGAVNLALLNNRNLRGSASSIGGPHDIVSSGATMMAIRVIRIRNEYLMLHFGEHLQVNGQLKRLQIES